MTTTEGRMVADYGTPELIGTDRSTTLREWGMLSLRDLLRPLLVQALEAPIHATGGG